MVDVTFIYDFSHNEWICCEDQVLNHKSIEKLSHALILDFSRGYISYDSERYFFCQNHHRLERIDPDIQDDIVSVYKCRPFGIFAYQRIEGSLADFFSSKLHVPFRWRISQMHHGGILNIFCDVATIYSPDGRFCSMQWHNVSYSINIARQKKVVIRHDIMETWHNEEDGDIPEVVLNLAMELLRTDMGIHYGLKPSVLSKMSGHRKIDAFIERPYDLNIVYLKPFLSELIPGEFDRIFPREAKDNYRILCRILNIKPPKSLRKAYTFNPFSIVWYLYFCQIGIDDVNLMRPFFDLNERILHKPFSQIYFSPRSKTVEFSGDSQYFVEQNDWLHFYGFWLIQQGHPKRWLKLLYRLSSAQESLTSWQWDILRSFFEYHRQLSNPIKKRLLKDGLTRYVHDLMSWEITVLSRYWNQASIEYPEYILAYECRIDDYEFRLIKNTSELTEFGYLMKNCVATYRERILDHHSIIVSVRYDNKYVACIELQDETNIRQALGVCNHRLEGPLLLVCRFWAKQYNLSSDTDHLSLPMNEENIPLLQDLQAPRFEPFQNQENEMIFSISESE